MGTNGARERRARRRLLPILALCGTIVASGLYGAVCGLACASQDSAAAIQAPITRAPGAPAIRRAAGLIIGSATRASADDDCATALVPATLDRAASLAPSPLAASGAPVQASRVAWVISDRGHVVSTDRPPAPAFSRHLALRLRI